MTGPTASGKTELLDSVFGRGAFSFFASLGKIRPDNENLPSAAAVISADSMQAYRGMDIGTAKPEAELLCRLPHHLIDIKNPDEQYTAGEFVRLADALCVSLAEKNIVPVISGGTGFYLKSFVCGTGTAPPADPAVRKEVAGDLERLGPEKLRRQLAEADPASAARINERDLYRLTRAVEILRMSGQPPSYFAPSSEPRSGYEFLILGVERPRDELKRRIHARVEKMFEAGLAEEVDALKSAGYTAENPGLKAIGYSEFFSMEGAPRGDIAEAIELHTNQYMKRQMTFLRALPGIRWMEADPDLFSRTVVSFLSGSRR